MSSLQCTQARGTHQPRQTTCSDLRDVATRKSKSGTPVEPAGNKQAGQECRKKTEELLPPIWNQLKSHVTNENAKTGCPQEVDSQSILLVLPSYSPMLVTLGSCRDERKQNPSLFPAFPLPTLISDHYIDGDSLKVSLGSGLHTLECGCSLTHMPYGCLCSRD